MLLRSTLIAAGLFLAAATGASAQAVIVEPAPFYGPPFYGPGFYGPPVYAAPAPVVVAPPAYYGGWGPPGPFGPFYDVGVVAGPGWW
jgi:hypothetical protein